MARLRILGIGATLLMFVAIVLGGWPGQTSAAGEPRSADAPRIVNVVNFIRVLEPRDAAITEDVLYQTVVKQVELMNECDLPGTFLLQYDALMDERYQKLLKGLPTDRFEVGAWWEIPQPLVEKAGLKWRGRYPWDWHANVGFASGYTPAEREKLVDVYMADFHAIFGHYPKSVASWFIDAHTLGYMHEKYGIIASANCKDQTGTDGYTLRGGYWNGAYYPSKLNAYMPAQTEAGQIPVPIFRMLGSDPLRQYDTGIGSSWQGVTTLEPVYGDSGGSPQWVDWFLRNFVGGECLAYDYAQVGQENSFTWNAMHKGLEYQFPLIARLRDEGKLRVETLADSGEWFRRRFSTTPATAMTFLTPLGDDHRQTVWYDSRYYRTSLIWENGALRIRDLHVFDQSVESPILRKMVDQPAVEFYTLPVVDGFAWSSPEKHAGLVFKAKVDGQEVTLTGGQPKVSRAKPGVLRVVWPLTNAPGELVITLDERAMQISLRGAPSTDWWLEFVARDDAELPFTQVGEHSLTASFQGTQYQVESRRGEFQPEGKGLLVRPERGTVTLELAAGK